MEDVNKGRRILFRSLKLSALLKKSTSRKFAYICHFQQIGINATVFEKRELILKLTFSLPLPSSMLKLPNGRFATNTLTSAKTISPATQAITEGPRTSQGRPGFLGIQYILGYFNSGIQYFHA